MSVNVLHLWQCLTSRNVSPLELSISRNFSPVAATHPHKWFTCGSFLLLGECLTCTSVPAEKFLTCGSPSPAQLSHLCSSLNCTTLTCGGPSPAQLSHLWKALTCTTVSPVEVPHLHNCLTCGSSSSAQLPHLWKFLTGTTVSPGRVSPVKVPHFCGSASPAHDLAVEVPHLWQCPIVPDVAMVGEDIFDIAKLALLHILLDRVHLLLLADLVTKQNFICVCVLTCINTVTPPPQHTYPQAAIDPRGKTAVHPPNVTTKGVISPGNVAHYHRKVAPWRLCKHV